MNWFSRHFQKRSAAVDSTATKDGANVRKAIHIDRQFSEAFRDNDIEAVSRIIKIKPKLLKNRITGGDLLYQACQRNSAEMIKYLMSMGFSVHSRSKLYGVSTLTTAARHGRYDIVKFLIDEGVTLDTETALQNPLFAAVYSGNLSIVSLVLDQGFDPLIAYTSDTMTNMNAIGFGFWNFEDDAAELIIDYVSQGDPSIANKLRSEAKKTF